MHSELVPYSTTESLVTAAPRRRLGDLLLERGYLREEQLRAALDAQRQSGRTKLLGEILLELGFCS